MSAPYYWPQMVVWETTLRCNMRCIHCGSTAGLSRSSELSTEECLDVCRQLVEMNSERVILSGGETFLRHDWPLIAAELIEGGSTVGVVTNALVITDAVLSDLVRLRQEFPSSPITIGVSLDGIGAVHEYIRGVPGAYEKVLERCHCLRENDIPFSLITTITQASFAQLRDLARVVRSLEPYAWQLQIVNGYGRAAVTRELAITEQQYIEAVNFIAETRRAWDRPYVYPSDCIGYFGNTESALRDDYPWHGCHAGIRGLGIQSNGNVKGCLSMIDDVFVEGNVRETSLWDLWTKPGAFAYNREFTPDLLRGACVNCDHGATCRAGCSGMAHSYTGSCFENHYCVTAIMLKMQEAREHRDPIHDEVPVMSTI